MSKIVDFYAFDGTDHTGLNFWNLIGKSDVEWEKSHDIIQWVFPLHQKSEHSDDAPVLSNDDIRLLQVIPEAQARMYEAWLRYSIFLGFLEFNDKLIINRRTFEQNSKRWLVDFNHNHLRITRVIRSLRLFDNEEYAAQFYNIVMSTGYGTVNQQSLNYWTKARFAPVLEVI